MNATLTRRTALRLLLAGTGAGLLAACAPPPAPSPTPTSAPVANRTAAPYTGAPMSVTAVVQGRPDQAPFELGFRRGYFTQQGFDVQTVLIPTGAEALQAIATNQAQFGPTSPSAAVFNAINRGIDLRLVADADHLEGAADTTLSIMVRADLASSVKSMADLKGKNVAVGGAPGSVGDFFIARAAQKDGITPDDMQLSYLSLGDISAALANGKVDAAMLTEPIVTQLKAQGIASVLYPGGAIIPGSHLAVFCYSAPFAAQPEAATRFMIALLQGIRDYDDAFFHNIEKEAAIDTLVQYLSLKDRSVWENATPSKLDTNGKINVDDLRTQEAFYAQRGQLQGGQPDLSKYVDPQFATAAVGVLGVRSS